MARRELSNAICELKIYERANSALCALCLSMLGHRLPLCALLSGPLIFEGVLWPISRALSTQCLLPWVPHLAMGMALSNFRFSSSSGQSPHCIGRLAQKLHQTQIGQCEHIVRRGKEIPILPQLASAQFGPFCVRPIPFSFSHAADLRQ